MLTKADWRPGDEPAITNHVTVIDKEGYKTVIPLPKGVSVELHIEP